MSVVLALQQAQYVHCYNPQHSSQFQLDPACILITPFLKSNSRAGCNQERVTYDGREWYSIILFCFLFKFSFFLIKVLKM